METYKIKSEISFLYYQKAILIWGARGCAFSHKILQDLWFPFALIYPSLADSNWKKHTVAWTVSLFPVTGNLEEGSCSLIWYHHHLWDWLSWLFFLHGCKIAAATPAITSCVQSQMKWKGQVPVPFYQEGRSFPRISQDTCWDFIGQRTVPEATQAVRETGKVLLLGTLMPQTKLGICEWGRLKQISGVDIESAHSVLW